MPYMRPRSTTSLGRSGYAFMFLPGSYSVDVPVGFYTEVMGLGAVARCDADHGQRACGCDLTQQCDDDLTGGQRKGSR